MPTKGGVGFLRLRFEKVVLALCPDIECRETALPPAILVEADARRELVGCVLSSQIRHTAAVAWTSAFEQAGLLEDSWWIPEAGEEFRYVVMRLLAGEHPASRKIGRYRFFQVRAKQLSTTRDTLATNPLQALLSATEDIRTVRRALVRDVAGLGPKQASMLLRNLGISSELAVLDRYVLRYMAMAGLIADAEVLTGRISQYEALERVLVEYSHSHGFAPGHMDWAIWATMKAAAELGL